MNTKNYSSFNMLMKKLCVFSGSVCRLLLLAAMALPAWQVMAGDKTYDIGDENTKDRTVMNPWKFLGVHYEEFENPTYATWSVNGHDTKIWERDNKVDDKVAGYGYHIERQRKDYTSHARVMYEITEELPPYAVVDIDWNYRMYTEGDKEDRGASLYYFGNMSKEDVEAANIYISAEKDADNTSLTNHEYVVACCLKQTNGYSSWDSEIKKVLQMTFDNRNSQSVSKLSQYIIHCIVFGGESNDGHAQGYLGTISYTRNHYYFPRFNGSGTAESPLQIGSGADLKAFADIINSGIAGTEDLHAVLVNDIDYTSYTDASAMIGTKDHPYEGVFDGQGHSIQVAFDVNYEDNSGVGLFRRVKGATIQNLSLSGTVSGYSYIGSAVGFANGNVLLENVISSVRINMLKSDTPTTGGLVSLVESGSTLTFKNAAFRGALLAANGSNACGGLLGYVRSGGKAEFTNCYFAPTEVTIDNHNSCTFGCFAETDAVTLTNCYYTYQLGEAQGTQVTEAQMESGEVCYLLNNKTDWGVPWLQTIGVDSRPVLNGALPVFRSEGGYYFNFEPSFRGAGTELDPFQIETVQQLKKFRDIVNAGYTTMCAKLVADIDLADHNWERFGVFNGIFDGNGYTISNLSINVLDETIDNAGLFGYVRSATIKNLIVHNATIQGANPKLLAAPIAGYMSDSTIITNCGVSGIVTLKGYKNSGIAYNEKTLSDVTDLSNCYTVYDNVSYKGNSYCRNCYCGSDVKNMHSSGELTYKLNGGGLSPWKQTIGRDEYPLLRGALSVYYDSSTKTYYNDSYQGGDEASFIENTSGKDFRVIHHGGSLYEFVITMATQDGAGISICPNAKVRYNIDGVWQDIFTLSDVNKDSLDFSKDWWGKIDYVQNQGTVYDSRTYHRQVPTFWIRQGNHTTCKQTSLLWIAPESLTVKPSSFMLKGADEQSQLSITSSPEKSVLSDDAGFTVVDPLPALDQTDVPGGAYLIITASNKVYSYGLWDATDNCFLGTEELLEGSNNLNLLLPRQECNHDLVAIMHTCYVTYDSNGKADTTYTVFGAPVVQKPSHSIIRTNIRRDYSYNASNRLEWAIGFPSDEDLLDSDMFTIGRSYTSDYANLRALGSISFTDTSYTDQTTVQDTVLGWFCFTDSTKESHYTTERYVDTLSAFDTWNLTESQKSQLSAYRYPARYLYYKIWRSTFGSAWSSSDLFSAYWKVLLTDVLPTVDTVRIIKDDNFDQNHKITVRVILNNPYPWDVVSESDRSDVYAEAVRQNFNHRLFTWDENAKIHLQRYSTADEYDNGNDVIAKSITFNGNQIKQDNETGAYYVEYSDIASMAFVHYYYKARVDNSESNYPICENRNKYVSNVDPCYTEQFGGVYNFKATKGTERGIVNLTWEADENSGTTLSLKRHEYQRGYASEQPLAGWTTMTAAEGQATDEEAVAAVVNEYIITITTKYREHTYCESDTAYGYADWHGTLSGRVKLENGVNMPGNVRVNVERGGAFDLTEVTDPRNGEVVLPSVHYDGIKRVLPTDATGCYLWDSIPFYGSGMQYEVSASCDGATFVSPTGTSANITLTYEDANSTYSDIDFTCNDTKRFSGRILYTNSTVPVRDVCFIVNETILRDASGSIVTTDDKGNFSFIVPRVEVTVQAFKQGHIMTNGGYILGGDSGEDITFTPTRDYDGLVIYDDTKVRLVGHIAGGAIQGAKPMGFGLGHNNLGDDITVVLQLEGDNTSFLYYDKKNPDSKSYTESFTQTVMENYNKEERIPTDVTFESKRIIVKADNETGEFCLDLFPAKYKISQIYANGYSTLYGANEGLTVMDLSDSVGLHVHYADHSQTEYDASFRKVYHAPVQVDLLQLQNSRYQKLYGSQSIEVGMLSGMQEIQLAWTDTAGVAQYSFGYPVYKSYKQYNFMVQAYERYYYNNNPLGSYERVPMAGCEVSISNGFNKYADDEEEEEGDEEEEGLMLNGLGCAMFSIIPDNTTFSLTGKDALRYISASVDINDYHYESEPIAAYITGDCTTGTEILTSFESAPQILDYIRDPYGEESYAYRTAGTTYNWARHYESSNKWVLDIDAQEGVAIYSSVGMGYTIQTEYDVYVTENFNYVIDNNLKYKDGEFSLTLSDQISTSEDPRHQGAMADLYLGSASVADVVKYQTFNIVDSLTFDALKPSIRDGVAKLVSEGRNSDGTTYYLVICGGVTWQPGVERTFVYSQDYIINVLIQNLVARRDEALRLAVSADEAASLVKLTGKTYYFIDKEGEYEPVYPSTLPVKVDTVGLLNERISNWQNIIAENERIKYEAMSRNANMKYSIGCMKLEHSEEASTYYRVTEANGPNPVNFSIGISTEQGTIDGVDHSATQTSFKGGAFRFAIAPSVGSEVETSNSYENYTTMEGGSGFLITAIDNCYYDLDIYYEMDTSIVKANDNFKNDINNYEGGSGVDDYVVTNDTQKMTDDNSYVHSYIFVMRAGASRNRWLDADSSYFYKPDGARVALGVPTLKIDNPKIYVDDPVKNNVPQDEKAVFTIHMRNESEMTGNVPGIISSVFLHVDESSNPYGARLSIDGLPLRNNMEFFLCPGESITKTLEVERGAKPFDYENIRLELTDDLRLLKDVATISVHYLPTSSPVKLVQPAQNFLINTLSQVDEDGKYYIPVEIGGFSTTKYDNFDHIELQYKRQADSEDQWVNLCSYFMDDSLYNIATGTKDMIETEGKITGIRFYGENDPIEMKYDLRAVTFCRLGTGYTTRMSEVISGMKDTRCPEVFGLPKPVDGILGFDDVISLPFTEPIAYNYLDETANFSVQGYTNSSDADNSVSLYFSGADNQKAQSTVTRVLNDMDFTVEMNVQPNGGVVTDKMSFISVPDEYGNMDDGSFVFGYNPVDDRLEAHMTGQTVTSMPLKATYGINICSAMTHVGMTYEAADSTVRFFVSEDWVEVTPECKGKKYYTDANGIVKFGYKYQGRMGNIRLWSKALNGYEMSSKYKTRLSANESNLLGYWPAYEASGKTAHDIIHGADVALENVSWSLPDGFSVSLDRQPMQILSDQALKFTRDKAEDFTLSFWFKAEQADASADLFAAGSDALEEIGMDKVRIRFIDGVLYYITEGNRFAFGSDNDLLTSAAWHYLAVTVNHSQKKLSLFIDGQLVNEAKTEGVGGMTGSSISFGSTAIKSHIDQIQVWGMALPASYIREYYNTALTGTEKELLVYMSFEQDEENSQGTMFVSFSPYNQVITSAGTIAGDKMADIPESQQDRNDIAPIHSSTGIQNLPFKWKSTDNELQITLDNSMSEINGQQVNIVVRNVEDVNGNPMKNAQMWSAYVNYNVLSWVVDPRSVILPYGTDTTFTAIFSNASGKTLSYTIDCSCPFITLSQTKGTVGPLSAGMVAIQISGGLAPGVYCATVNLVDENNLCSPLAINILVKATEPEWQVTADASYSQTMKVAAVVKKHTSNGWAVDMCGKDVVAAFIGKTCVGKSYLTVDATDNTSYVFLSVRGKEELQGTEIQFSLFDALKGETSFLNPGSSDASGSWTAEPVCFEANAIVGGIEPIEMRTSEMKVQTLSLNPGWNWISLNVKPLSSTGLTNLFQNEKAFVPDDMFKHLYEGFAYFQSDYTWESSLDDMSLDRDNVYQVYSKNGGNVTISGTSLSDEELIATLDFSYSEWAEMAYLSDQSQPVGRALSDFVPGTAKAPAGTLVKGYGAFAVAREDGTWFGSLSYLRPGEGYYVWRNGSKDKVQIRFSNTTTKSAPASQAMTKSGFKASSSMPVIAMFSEDWQAGDVLLAIVNGEVVGRAEAMTLDGQAVRFMLSVLGEDGDKVTFAKERNGEIVAATTKTLSFDGRSVLGSLDKPYLIDFEETTVEGVYDVMGLRYNGQDGLPSDRVFIIGDKKVINKK